MLNDDGRSWVGLRFRRARWLLEGVSVLGVVDMEIVGVPETSSWLVVRGVCSVGHARGGSRGGVWCTRRGPVVYATRAFGICGEGLWCMQRGPVVYAARACSVRSEGLW